MKPEIIFVLVEPAVHENIGAAARAIKTMGFTKLRLVNPVNHLDERARWVAHASHEVLENAQVYTTLEDALSDIDISIAATVRTRTVKRDIISSRALKSFLEEKDGSILKAAVVFGREESGLTNEELSRCDTLTCINLAAAYPSLNLSQAVMIYAYELSARASAEAPPENEKSSLPALKSKTQAILDSVDIQKDSNLYLRTFELIAQLNGKQIRIMQSLFDRILDTLKR
jgi:tRNA/rRNA methyltransferase